MASLICSISESPGLLLVIVVVVVVVRGGATINTSAQFQKCSCLASPLS
jgi:hypothetical protein